MWGKTDQENSEYGHFLCSGIFPYKDRIYIFYAVILLKLVNYVALHYLSLKSFFISTTVFCNIFGDFNIANVIDIIFLTFNSLNREICSFIMIRVTRANGNTSRSN